MCRWIAYFSHEPILIADVIQRPEHSLVKQIDQHYLPGIQHPAADEGRGSQNSFSNVDGWGLGWYSPLPAKYRLADNRDPDTGEVTHVPLPSSMPTVLKSVMPPLHDTNLLSIANSVESEVVFGHIRAAGDSPIATMNCHPFQFGKWLFMHNGFVGPFKDVQDQLRAHISLKIRQQINGTTDTETVAALFFSLLSPSGDFSSPHPHTPAQILFALRTTVKLVVETCTPADGWLDRFGHSKSWVSLNLAITDGESFVALRYAYPPEREAPSLYWSTVGGSTLDRRYLRHPDGGRDVGPLHPHLHLPHLVVASEPMTRNKHDSWFLLEQSQAVVVTKSDLQHIADHDTASRKGHPGWHPKLVDFEVTFDPRVYRADRRPYHAHVGLGKAGRLSDDSTQVQFPQWLNFFNALPSFFAATGQHTFPTRQRQQIFEELARVLTKLQRGELHYLPLPEDPVFLPTLRQALHRQIGLTIRAETVTETSFPWHSSQAALPMLFEGVTAVGRQYGTPEEALDRFSSAWKGFVGMYWARLSRRGKAQFVQGLFDTMALSGPAWHHAFDARYEHTSPASQGAAAALAVSGLEGPYSLAKSDMRALGHRQQRIYGQSRAMGDLGAEERRPGRAF
ncbi:hypothetical protein JCM10207_007243 [Rhodosporidiobolus poonsookiae]